MGPFITKNLETNILAHLASVLMILYASILELAIILLFHIPY